MVQEKNIPMYLTIGSCIVPIFIVVPIIYFYLMLSNIKLKNKLFYTMESDDEKWIYGFIYTKNTPFMITVLLFELSNIKGVYETLLAYLFKFIYI